MSKADINFILDSVKTMEYGISDQGMKVRPHWEDGIPAYTKSIFGVMHEYDLSKGEFPMLTLRRTYWKTAIRELIWIWIKKSNNIHDLKGHIWDQWADETGSIGKAYGYQLAQKHQYPEGYMDPVDHLLWQLKNDPASRRMVVTMWNPEDLKDMALSPCAYEIICDVRGGFLNMTLIQRSQDSLAAVAHNEVFYSVLQMLLAQVSGLKPGKFIHYINNYHIYDRHEEIVAELIKKPCYEAPKVVLNPDIKNFYDFTEDDLWVTDYQYNEFNHKIPIAI